MTIYINLLRRWSILQMEMETQQSYVGLMDQLVMYTALALPETDNTLTDLKEEAVSAHTTYRPIAVGGASINLLVISRNRRHLGGQAKFSLWKNVLG